MERRRPDSSMPYSGRLSHARSTLKHPDHVCRCLSGVARACAFRAKQNTNTLASFRCGSKVQQPRVKSASALLPTC